MKRKPNRNDTCYGKPNRDSRKPIFYTDEDLYEARQAIADQKATTAAEAAKDSAEANTEYRQTVYQIMELLLKVGEIEPSNIRNLMENLENLRYTPRFGISKEDHKRFRDALRTNVREAWEKEQTSLEVCFKLYYAAQSLQVDLPKPKGNTKRKKKAAILLFKLYQNGVYQNIEYYIEITRLM